jgi:hypothetical protein
MPMSITVVWQDPHTRVVSTAKLLFQRGCLPLRRNNEPVGDAGAVPRVVHPPTSLTRFVEDFLPLCRAGGDDADDEQGPVGANDGETDLRASAVHGGMLP